MSFRKFKEIIESGEVEDYNLTLCYKHKDSPFDCLDRGYHPLVKIDKYVTDYIFANCSLEDYELETLKDLTFEQELLQGLVYQLEEKIIELQDKSRNKGFSILEEQWLKEDRKKNKDED